MQSPKINQPYLIIIAGPNGSGKSTAYENTLVAEDDRSAWIINPDILAARIRDLEHVGIVEANLEAVKRIEAWLESSILAYQTVGVETGEFYINIELTIFP